MHGLHQQKVKESGPEDHENEPGATPTVKNNAAGKDHRILKAVGSEVVDQQKNREKINQEGDAAEDHKIADTKVKLFASLTLALGILRPKTGQGLCEFSAQHRQ